MMQNLTDQSCQLFKWLCNYRSYTLYTMLLLESSSVNIPFTLF